jgi:hypothetical protein
MRDPLIGMHDHWNSSTIHNKNCDILSSSRTRLVNSSRILDGKIGFLSSSGIHRLNLYVLRELYIIFCNPSGMQKYISKITKKINKNIIKSTCFSLFKGRNSIVYD